MKDFLKIPQKFFYTYKNFLNKQYEFYKNNSSQHYLECTLERYNKTLYKAQVKSFSKENKFFFNFLQSLKIDEILICKSDTSSFEWVEVVLKNIDFKFREGKYTYTLYLQFPKDFQYREGVIHWHLLKPDYKLISYDLQKKVLENSFSKSLVSDSTEASEFLEQKYFKVFGNFYFDPFHDSDNEEDEQTPKSLKKEQTRDMHLIFENLQKELEIPIQTLKTKIKETFPNSSNSKLNDPYQEYCISSIQKAISFDGKQGLGNVFCIWGPPGTGKTTVIVELCKRLIKNKPDILIAITSFTNVAVDNVLEKLLNHNKEIKMKRNGLEARVRPSIQPITKMISKEDLVDLNILGVTLDSLLFPKWELNQEGDERIFDLTIIDEASMASFPKIANALRKSKNVILVGDFLQLHPFDEIKGQFANPDTKEQYKQCSTFSYFSYICLYLLKQIETNPDIQEIKQCMGVPLPLTL